MKYLIISALSGLILAVGGVNAYALPTVLQKAENNPNTVAYYATGLHGIPDEPGIDHEGEDLVMKDGNSGNFQQWFYGNADEDGGIIEGEHTLWQEKDPNKDCPDDFTLIPNAKANGWGDYLADGADYCVKSNDFTADNIPGL